MTEQVEHEEFQTTKKMRSGSVQEMHIADRVGDDDDERQESSEDVEEEQRE